MGINYFVRVLGLLKLLIYKMLFGYHIKFDYTVCFHAFANVHMDKGSFLQLGQHSIIEKNVYIEIASGGSCIMGKHAYFRKSSYLEIGSDAQLIVAEGAFINRSAQIVCMNEITLGKHVAIGTGVSMFDHDHCYYADCVQDWTKSRKGTIIIDHDVWIGANVTLLRGCKIGHNSVIGAGVVVKENIRENVLMYLDRRCYSYKSILAQDDLELSK